jgi:hypothetical protein
MVRQILQCSWHSNAKNLLVILLGEMTRHEICIVMDLIARGVVLGSVREAKAHISGELLGACVYPTFYLLFDHVEADRLLDHLKVIRNVQCHGVNLFFEPNSPFVFGA